MKKVEEFVTRYHEVNMKCTYRRMWGILSEIQDMCQEIDKELQNEILNHKCDYEGDIETIILYYDYCDENHIKLWKMICEKYDIEYKEDIDTRTHLVC